jgi:hypothetical protein
MGDELHRVDHDPRMAMGQVLWIAEAGTVRSRGHRVKHDSRMLDRPPRPVGAVNVLILAAQLFALIPQPPGNAHAGRADLPRNPRRHLLGRKQRFEILAPRACLP